MRFAASLEAIALTATELPLVAQSVPVAFMRSDLGWRAMAVFSPSDGVNRFVTEDGYWRGNYVPCLLRAYPFTLSFAKNSSELKLWPGVRAEPLTDGVEPFLINGKPTEQIRKTISFLMAVNSDINNINDAICILNDADLLRTWPLEGFENGLSLGGKQLFVVDSVRLKELDDGIFIKLKSMDVLPWIYAHIQSLHHAKLLFTKNQPSSLNILDYSVNLETEKNKQDLKKTVLTEQQLGQLATLFDVAELSGNGSDSSH